MKNNKEIKKRYGQYFTPSYVADFMVSLISKPKNTLILDPCAGTGIFPISLRKAGFKNIVAYEIDETLPNHSEIEILRRDFLKLKPNEQFDVIIGNPPYVRWRNIPTEWKELFKKSKYWSAIMNGLSDLTYAFIYHSINMLKENGELIFITPVFWTQTVHGARLRDYLTKYGHVEVLINLNEMKIFKEVSSTIIIFKYIKKKVEKPIKIINLHTKDKLTVNHLKKVKLLIETLKGEESYIQEGVYKAFVHEQFRDGDPWKPVPKIQINPLFSFEYSPILHFRRISLLGSLADIGNGMVSGLDKAFSLENIDIKKLTPEEREKIIYVYKARNLDRLIPKTDPVPYLFVNDINDEEIFKELYPNFYNKLISFKEKLLKRYNYGIEIPWWHWVFLRNKHLLEKYNEKIFVPSKERYDSKGYFRFAYVEGPYYATQDVTTICIKNTVREGIKYILALLNSEPYQEYILYKGFSRGGVFDFSERPLADIPIVRIDWNNSKEVKLYNDIVAIVDTIIMNKSYNRYIDELNQLVDKLLQITLN
ncbi:hypothetical protein Asulf_01374 [Archaeoglobus sulfaticallidus PM70-1]|uniref:site-specific DNA-methyltransferase (adenine-specific) n=1 Tax=Archaeoglobus sulfaticallidus PM70-1 TaxID=387631 RepID=N0BM68_9EURY|nr:N-6 DNA methylase [Archaeoglobus sulfaticallidus]AGK61365.1 hypothetical protein Asulf_01374 [Archaeoglobus sulfaticallidus PM70-1]